MSTNLGVYISGSFQELERNRLKAILHSRLHPRRFIWSDAVECISAFLIIVSAHTLPAKDRSLLGLLVGPTSRLVVALMDAKNCDQKWRSPSEKWHGDELAWSTESEEEDRDRKTGTEGQRSKDWDQKTGTDSGANGRAY